MNVALPYERMLKLIWIICCIVLALSAESSTADELKSVQNKELKSEVFEGQFDEEAVTQNTIEFLLSAGLRKDILNWNEAGGAVNIISELKWTELDIALIGASAKFNFNADWSLRGMLDYGRINSGSNQDSDYNGNNRTLEFSRSNNRGGGEVRDASISIGRVFQVLGGADKGALSIIPLVGLSVHQQNLTMTDGFQTLPATGSYPGLDSSYHAQWQGPWVGLDSTIVIGGNWSLNATAEYHWADYSAKANWNLRSEFSHPVSFTHSAKGQGVVLAAGAHYKVSKDWKASIIIESQQWSTGSGIDQTYLANGSIEYYLLNEVNWQSAAVKVGVSHYF